MNELQVQPNELKAVVHSLKKLKRLIQKIFFLKSNKVEEGVERKRGQVPDGEIMD